MGTTLSQQQKSLNQSSQNRTDKTNINKNWKILQKGDNNNKQILKSIKTGLIVERYSFEIENYQDFQQENKLFQWRNNNPNSEFMVNVLSTNKDENGDKNKTFQCSSLGLCPSQKINTKIYVVTQRILKLGQITDLLAFQQQTQRSVKSQQTNNQTSHITTSQKKQKKKYNKLIPFINFTLTQHQAKSIIKDWLRGIQVLCYKFGYFSISYDHLGINIRKKGNVWINQNYALNHLNNQNRIQVSTAEQKFKYEKDTIQKILLFTQNICWFKNIVQKYVNKKIQTFDDFVLMLDKRQSHERRLNQKRCHNSIVNNYQFGMKKQNNISLFVQPPSFIQADPKSFSHNNSSFFQFDHQNVLKRINSNQKYLVSLQDPERHLNRISKLQIAKNNLINKNEDKDFKRSNTGEKILANLSPQSRHQSRHNQNFVNSNHINCGKQTAPTNELGHSSSMQSVAHPFIANMPVNMNDQFLKQQGKGLFKTQNNTKFNSLNPTIDINSFKKPGSSPSNKVYFHHHNNRPFISNEPHIFRSQNYNYVNVNNFNSPKAKGNQKANRDRINNINNYSLDENNIVGPYRKDRFYSNLKNKQIALVDSMVMVRQQSEEVEEDFHNLSGTKVILEESIILMGNQDPILGTPRQNDMKSPSRKNSSFYH